MSVKYINKTGGPCVIEIDGVAIANITEFTFTARVEDVCQATITFNAELPIVIEDDGVTRLHTKREV